MAALLTFLAVACSSDPSPSSTTDATLPPDQTTVLASAAKVMGEVDFVEFTIERSGAPVHIDTFEILVFNNAAGRFAAPTSADALVTVEAAGFLTEIGAIASEGQTWLSDPITGNFAPAPGSYAFDPATLFDPEVGWRPLLESGLTDIAWTGAVTRGTESRYHLTGLADPHRLEVITAGLVRNQEVVLDLWLDPVSGAVREVEFSTVNDGATSTWVLTFHGYGEALDITPPPTTPGD